MHDMLHEFSGLNISSGNIQTGDFKQRMERYAKRVSDDFVKYNKDMNEQIAKIAKENDYNDEQIQRIVEESNNLVYLAKYASLKSQNERDVVFKTASLSGVKNILGDTIQKQASYKEDFHIDAFSSYNPYKTGALTPAKAESLVKTIAEKLASDVASAANDLDAANNRFDAHIYKIADTLIRYDRTAEGVSDVYTTMCKEAKLPSAVQGMIQKVANEIIEDEKFAGSINSEYTLKLPHVDIYKKEADFSLGKHSMLEKTAMYTHAMQCGDTVVYGIDDMVKMAEEIRPLFEDVSAKKIAFNKAVERADFSKEK